jgi:tRNA threonylcarbamoyladenosine biosynthesis protein TsaB
MDARVTIRPMTVGDLDRVMEIAGSLAHAPHWPRQAYATALDRTNGPRRVALVAEGPEKVIGFAISLLVGPEAELETIGVALDWQRQGVGRALLNVLDAALRHAGVTKVLLEVRDSNQQARQFYRSQEFPEIGRRTDYYTDPKEDAVLMGRML